MSGKGRRPKDEPGAQKSTRETSFPRWLFGHIFALIRRHGDAIAFWIGVGYCVKQLATASQAFSGKTSLAGLKFSILANVNFVWTASVTVSGISIVLYLKERSMHRKTRARLAARITDLESKIDPLRTSSHLTPEGLTRREDE